MSTDTTLTIKIDKKLKEDAKRTAEKMGLKLTTVVVILLRQFVRNKKITLSAE